MFKYMEWDKYLGLRKLSFYDTLSLTAKAKKQRRVWFLKASKIISAVLSAAVLTSTMHGLRGKQHEKRRDNY